MYALVRWVLFRLEPELAHRITIEALKVFQFLLFMRLIVFVLCALGAQHVRRWWSN